MLKKIAVLALLVCSFYSPCQAVTTVDKLVDDFSVLSALEQRKFSQRLEGTSVNSEGVVEDIVPPFFFDPMGLKRYYLVTSEPKISPLQKRKFSVIYCYVDGKKALAFKKGDIIKGYGFLVRIEDTGPKNTVWLEMK